MVVGPVTGRATGTIEAHPVLIVVDEKREGGGGQVSEEQTLPFDVLVEAKEWLVGAVEADPELTQTAALAVSAYALFDIAESLRKLVAQNSMMVVDLGAGQS